jgi:hypothetical protein
VRKGVFVGPKERRKICKWADQSEARVHFNVAALQEHRKDEQQNRVTDRLFSISYDSKAVNGMEWNI